MRYFTYPHTLEMVGDAFQNLFGFPRRRPEERITQEHLDLAASIQMVAEETYCQDLRIRQTTDRCQPTLFGGRRRSELRSQWETTKIGLVRPDMGSARLRRCRWIPWRCFIRLLSAPE